MDELFVNMPEWPSLEDLTLSQEYLTELGRVSYAYSALDNVVTSCVSALLSPDSTLGSIVCSKLYLRPRLPVLAALVRYRYGDSGLLSETHEIIRAAHAACESRNRLIHSIWVISHKPDEVGGVMHAAIKPALSAKHSIRYDGREIAPGDIRAVAEQLDVVAGRFWRLHPRLGSESVANTPWWEELLDDKERDDVPEGDAGAP
jgi:hypothetical protein